MYLCYIDEAGNGQTLDPSRPDAPPVLVVGGFTVHDSCIKQLTWDFLTVKKTYIACHAYLGDVTWNVHCDDAYRPLREEFGERLKKLQFRYQDPLGKWRGGIVVSDRRTAQPSSLMFRPGKADAHAVMIPVQQTGGGSLPSGV